MEDEVKEAHPLRDDFEEVFWQRLMAETEIFTANNDNRITEVLEGGKKIEYYQEHPIVFMNRRIKK